MELQKELKKLASYFGKDVVKFKEQFKRIKQHFTTEKQVDTINTFTKGMISRSIAQSDKTMEEIKLRSQLILNKEIIPFSFIAKNYFKKSKQWLYQRLNGNIVNGKPASFTATEIEVLRFALQDVSKKIGSVI